MADTQDLQASTASHQGGFEDEESLSPLEQEVLDEYARLLGNLNDVRFPFSLSVIQLFLLIIMLTLRGGPSPCADEHIAE